MKVDYQPVSYSEVFFREPESQADQNRMMSIVTTGEKNGYYVDISVAGKWREEIKCMIIFIIIWDKP